MGHWRNKGSIEGEWRTTDALSSVLSKKKPQKWRVPALTAQQRAAQNSCLTWCHPNTRRLGIPTQNSQASSGQNGDNRLFLLQEDARLSDKNIVQVKRTQQQLPPAHGCVSSSWCESWTRSLKNQDRAWTFGLIRAPVQKCAQCVGQRKAWLSGGSCVLPSSLFSFPLSPSLPTSQERKRWPQALSYRLIWLKLFIYLWFEKGRWSIL